MGMDVYGKAPIAPEGEYFRRNALNWGQLVDCVTTLCPQETLPCTGWIYNSGDGLNADGAAALGAKLEALRDSGGVAAYCAARDAWAGQPFYGGPGFGTAESIIKAAVDEVSDRITGFAKGAGLGDAMVAPARRFSASEIDDFIVFLKASGGFEIW
jgi:hypothetical protein